MTEQKRILHLVMSARWPDDLHPGAGDTVVFLSGSAPDPEDRGARIVSLAPEPSILLEFVFEHDTVVTW